ncbi:MAG: IS110 family transposase [Hyphomonadaceae bacterium]|nr:IS110 family transposase [Hyphomonadaceae bacterium]
MAQFASRDPVCLRFMAIPGVGPVAALAFKTAVDDPTRFKHARIVGAHFGLTPKRYQSGDTVDRPGCISKRGDKEVRAVLYEAAKSMLTRYKGWTALKAWGLQIAQRSGHKKAVAAVARKLAVIMYAMWRDDTEYRFSTSAATT